MNRLQYFRALFVGGGLPRIIKNFNAFQIHYLTPFTMSFTYKYLRTARKRRRRKPKYLPIRYYAKKLKKILYLISYLKKLNLFVYKQEYLIHRLQKLFFRVYTIEEIERSLILKRRN
jgi:hypothetical protein